jgi:hypothetical protein
LSNLSLMSLDYLFQKSPRPNQLPRLSRHSFGATAAVAVQVADTARPGFFP